MARMTAEDIEKGGFQNYFGFGGNRICCRGVKCTEKQWVRYPQVLRMTRRFLGLLKNWVDGSKWKMVKAMCWGGL